MSDEENEIPTEEPVEEEEPAEEPAEEPEEAAEEPDAAEESSTPAPRRAPPSEAGSYGGDKTIYAMKPAVPKVPQFSAGKPSKFSKDKLMASEGILRTQSGTNQYASQAGMTGMGVPRDVVDRIKCNNLKAIEDEAKIVKLKESRRLQSGTNIFDSQKGTRGFGSPRDVLNHTKGTGGVGDVPEEKQRATDGIVILQSGTNKLASQKGMTGMGAFRLVFTKNQPEQDKRSEGFVNLQMGTNKLASQKGMTGFGTARREVTKTTDEARGEIPFDENSISRQTTGWKEGANQNGMTGFGAFRNTTVRDMKDQDRESQGLIPYQMGINWGESQQGKTGMGMPRNVFTPYVDDSQTRPELPEDLARRPDVPFWSGMERDFANQSGNTAMGTARDVAGKYLRKLW